MSDALDPFRESNNKAGGAERSRASPVLVELPVGAVRPATDETPAGGIPAVKASGSEYRRAGQSRGLPGAGRETEVKPHPTHKRYTVAYKLKVLEDTDRLPEGEVGSYLRREGLYYSTLKMFREHRAKGLLQGQGNRVENKQGGRRSGEQGKQTGDQAGQDGATPAVAVHRITQLEKENRRLQQKLRRVETMLAVQKKASELLGIALGGLEDLHHGEEN